MLCERQLVDEWDQEHIALTTAGQPQEVRRS
jgi:hypothetical protein